LRYKLERVNDKKEKTVFDYIKDPNTGEMTWKAREVEVEILEDADRTSVVSDILKGAMTAEEAKEKYQLASINSVYSWIGKYMSQIKSVSLQDEPNYDDMANKSKDDQIKELKAALKKAQKEAELEKLRAHAYDKMIDLAEQHFNIRCIVSV
jgi:lysyl-tRNA synthetase class I